MRIWTASLPAGPAAPGRRTRREGLHHHGPVEDQASNGTGPAASGVRLQPAAPTAGVRVRALPAGSRSDAATEENAIDSSTEREETPNHEQPPERGKT